MDFWLRTQLSAMMFLQYFVWGAWGVVIFKYIASLPPQGGLNFPGNLQGWIGATLPIGAMITPFFVGLIADRLFATEWVLAVLHLLGAGLLVAAALICQWNLPKIRAAFENGAKARNVAEGNLLDAIANEKQLKAEFIPEYQSAIREVNQLPPVQGAVKTTFLLLFVIMLVYALCYMPTITLTNSLSFRNLRDPDSEFGSIRVLGTIGWIVAGLIVGFALSEVSSQPLYLAAGASAVLGVLCFALPHTPPAGEAKTVEDMLGLPALAMLRDWSFLVFFFCSFLITLISAFYFQQGNVFVTAIGAPYPAALQTIGQVSEIFFMLLLPVGLGLFGTKGMLILGMVAWCLRYAIFATQNVPAVIAVGLPLHGICYDFFFVVSYLYVNRHAPQDLRASAQGMIGFVTLGVGLFLGNLLAGQVVKKWQKGPLTNWTRIWLVPFVGAVAATLLFTIFFVEGRNEQKATSATKTAAPPAAERANFAG